jgi:Flp pilus assembly CpaF family ATPase
MTHPELPEDKKDKLRDVLQALNKNADKGREPELLTSKRGRHVSIQALIERIIDQFVAEHGERQSDAVQAAVTEIDRIKLVRDSTEYVIAVESIHITPAEKADIIRRTYAEMFGYGPLDKLFSSPEITTITLEGSEKVAIRYGHGDLTTHPPIFDDEAHLRRIIRRLIEDAGAQLRSDVPMIETGLTINNRRIGISVMLPPATVLISVDIRLHPMKSPALEDMVTSGMMPEVAAQLLTKIARSTHGVIVVGEPESGKTTLLGALGRLADGQIMTVERAGELALLPSAERGVVRWPNGESAGVEFDTLIRTTLEQNSDLIILDEVRADEAQAVAPLLIQPDVPRMMWAFRGAVDSKRLASSLGMLARLADPSAGEAIVRTLYERLPFVVTVRRRHGRLSLFSIAEWQFTAQSDYPDFVELMANGWDGLELTGRPSLKLE